MPVTVTIITQDEAQHIAAAIDSAAWADEDSEGGAAPPRVDAIDATAAGASFNAALAISIAEGRSLEHAVRFANAPRSRDLVRK